MDRVIIKKQSNVPIEKCGTCIYGKAKNLHAKDATDGWVYCILWNGQKPFDAWCSEFKS